MTKYGIIKKDETRSTEAQSGGSEMLRTLLKMMMVCLAGQSQAQASENRLVVFSHDPLVFQGEDEHVAVTEIEPRDDFCFVKVERFLGETKVYYDVRSDMELQALTLTGEARKLFPEIGGETFTITEIEYLARKICWPTS